MKFLKLIFGNSPMPQQACDGGNNSPSKPALDDAGIALAVSKATRQLEFIARTYGFGLCEGKGEDLQADLVTMLRFRDLSSIRFELLGHDGLVVFEFKLHFDASKTGAGRSFDSGNGIELPVLSRDLVAGRRLVIHRNGLESGYKHLLRLPWGGAKTIQKSQGAEYESEHAARISGGRQAGSFHVTDAVRRRFVITSSGTGAFRFAKDLGSGLENIFVLAKHWPAGYELRVGATFTGVLIQTPKGMQVRSLRPI